MTPPSRLLLIFAGFLTACMLLTGIAALVASQLRPPAYTLTLLIDQTAATVQTSAQTVGDLLLEQQIFVEEGDSVAPALHSTLAPNTTIEVNRARTVTLIVDDQMREYRTRLTNPAEILASAGLTVDASDRIRIDGTPTDANALAGWPVPVSEIIIRHARTLHIIDAGTRTTLNTTSETIGEALFEAGVTLYLADSVSPDMNTPVSDNLEVSIYRSRPVSILADGVIVETRATGGTVADALAEAGLALIGMDYAVPSDESPLLPGMRIRVIRVSEDLLTEEEIQPYESVYQPDSALELDQTTLAQAGQAGIVQRTVRVRYENGIEISRTEEETVVTQEKVNEVIAYGTNIVLRTVDTPDGAMQYWRRLRMYATSYHPAALGGDAVTATGRTLTKGIIASDPDVLPYDSQVYVPGYGVGIMADTGAFSRRLHIDLGYDDVNFVPWSRWVDVYLLAPPPDPAEIQYFLPQSE